MMPPDPKLIEALDAGCLVVTANQRLSRSLRNEYALAMHDRGVSAWHTPRILEWHTWVNTCWSKTRGDGLAEVLLSEAQADSIWEQIIAADSNITGGKRLARSARKAWRLMQEWRIPYAELKAYANPDSQSLAGWISSYEKYLVERNWVDPLMLDEQIDGDPSVGNIRLAGFFELNPRQQFLLDKFRAAGVRVSTLSRAVATSTCELRVCVDPEQELIAAATWAADRLNEQADLSLGIIVPRLAQQQDVVERIFARILQPGGNLPGTGAQRMVFHLSVGRPSLEQPLLKDALLALQLVINGLDSHELSRFLRSPYFQTGASLWQRSRLDVAFRTRWMEAASPANIAWQCSDKENLKNLREQMQDLQAQRPGDRRAAPAEWVGKFSDWLGRLGWPGERSLSSHEYQATAHWNDLLNELGKVGNVTGALSAQKTLERLLGLASATLFQPKAVAAPVEVMGTLEAAGSNFDAVWICGLDDASFPAAPEPAPLIPVSLQKKYGLPDATAERAIEFADRLISDLGHSAPDVVLSWAKIVEDEPRRVSPLLRGLSGESGQPLVAMVQESLAANPLARNLLASETESLDDFTGPPITGTGKQKGGSGIFTHQSQCPFRAFAMVRLGAENLDTPEPGISPRLKGDLAHQTLEFLWRHLTDLQGLLACSSSKLDTLIGNGFDRAWQLRKSETMLFGDGVRQLEKDRQRGLISRLLDYEKTRVADFRVLQTEELVVTEVGGLTIGMKIDRVDEIIDNGRRLIIDYKTGKDSALDSLGERPFKPQLAVYAVGSDKPLAGVCIARLNAESCVYDGILADAVLAPNAKKYNGSRRSGEETTSWDELLPAWKKRLNVLGEAFRAGDARTDPIRGACNYCHLSAACRILEYPDAGERS
ncbi:MAG: PD-(D/E)XK nuclease family protein [Proteobacteria bacterium]|nr:PD-(D/E)XK nuclease family protein [Pseudomonadota bacterium]